MHSSVRAVTDAKFSIDTRARLQILVLRDVVFHDRRSSCAVREAHLRARQSTSNDLQSRQISQMDIGRIRSVKKQGSRGWVRRVRVSNSESFGGEC
jgi:hypothetical protein